MNVARLVLDYMKALAWPAIVLIVMIFFRDEFRKLLRRLKSAKGGGASVEFSEEVQAVAEEARAAVEAEVRDARERAEEVRSVFEASRQAARAAADAALEPGTLIENGAPPKGLQIINTLT
ncbi:hypothetical protein [Streptomyces sp. NPDC093260]|uniref:hypothetical protein n=1 Tax=Streptomyces sp. NPDC093260 TaxID=3155073 RepID=UPI0034340E5C